MILPLFFILPAKTNKALDRCTAYYSTQVKPHKPICCWNANF